MKKTNLDALSSQYRISDYRELYAKVMALIEGRKIKPVKASGYNGKSPALHMEYWLIEEKQDTSKYVDELNYEIEPTISTDYYQAHIDQYIQDRQWNDAGKETTVCQSRIQTKTKDMAEKCGMEEPLAVDISLVEKEKSRIVELLGEYCQDMHGNLGQIDSNSTITIRGKAVKMLKLQLPDWAEQEGLYQLKLNDFPDRLTTKGVEILEKNENPQEYFGTRITTRNLYDSIVGIGNVQIKLYKVEAQREYPITWAQAAKNSGGDSIYGRFDNIYVLNLVASNLRGGMQYLRGAQEETIESAQIEVIGQERLVF